MLETELDFLGNKVRVLYYAETDEDERCPFTMCNAEQVFLGEYHLILDDEMYQDLGKQLLIKIQRGHEL